MSGNSEEQRTYALLDDGASESIMDDRFASDIDGPIVPLRLVTARGHLVTDKQSRKVKVTIKGGNGVFHDIIVRTLRDINLPSQTLPVQVLSENAHLRDLGCSPMEGAKPMLLLGQDNWELIVAEEISRGKSGRPVASLTKLGWVVHGPLATNHAPNMTDHANCMTVSQSDLHTLVKEQFELEAIGIS